MDFWLWVLFGCLLLALAVRHFQISLLEKRVVKQEFLIQQMVRQLDECGITTTINEDLYEIFFTEQDGLP